MCRNSLPPPSIPSFLLCSVLSSFLTTFPPGHISSLPHSFAPPSLLDSLRPFPPPPTSRPSSLLPPSLPPSLLPSLAPTLSPTLPPSLPTSLLPSLSPYSLLPSLCPSLSPYLPPSLQGCQLSRIWRDSHAFDLLLTHSRNGQIYSRILKNSHAYSRNLKKSKIIYYF